LKESILKKDIPMLEIERWGQGRYMPMVMLAQTIALSAKECHELIEDPKRRRVLILNQAKECSSERWLELYRNRSWVESFVLRLAFDPQDTDDLDKARHEIKLNKQATIALAKEQVVQQLTGGIDKRWPRVLDRLIARYYKRTYLPMIEGELRGNEPTIEKMEFWIKQPEILFFMHVVMPCWLEFHVSPWVLYAQARRGKYQALEQLIRLDSEVDKDPALAKRVFQLQREEPDRYDLLQRARFEGCKRKVSLADVKFLLGGLLLKLSAQWQCVLQGDLVFDAIEQNIIEEHRDEVLKWLKVARKRAARSPVKCRLKAPDIQELFDAIARDSELGLNDPDFAGEPHSISKRLRRNAGFWPNLWKADKKRAV
jgi:hypothetical protein